LRFNMSDPLRYGGPQGEDDDEAQRKAAEREQKKAEVRKRLEEAGQKKKKKKGFLTPERKKKLRKLLMMKAAENLKQQQLKSEQERQNVLKQRTIALPDVDSIEDKGKLESIYNELFARLVQLEEEKYDINQLVMGKDSEINELTIAVNDLRGKFVKPTLKKVSKYDNKFKKFAAGGGGAEGEGVAAAPKADFRSQLKVVKKDINEEIAAKTKKSDKPDWKEQAKAGPKAPVETKPAEEKPVEEKKEEAAPPPEPEPEPEPAAEEGGEEEEGGDEEEEEGDEEEEE